jgi:uncharacterized membrane protein YgdD (TMEM256/DUF423 family)
MQKIILMSGAVLAMVGVAMGAFGAHSFKEMLINQGENGRYWEIYQTASEYLFYHALGLLLIGVIGFNITDRGIGIAGIFILVGILIFSGSLYALSFSQIKVLGAITPIGGTLKIIGWGYLAFSIWKGM